MLSGSPAPLTRPHPLIHPFAAAAALLDLPGQTEASGRGRMRGSDHPAERHVALEADEESSRWKKWIWVRKEDLLEWRA